MLGCFGSKSCRLVHVHVHVRAYIVARHVAEYCMLQCDVMAKNANMNCFWSELCQLVHVGHKNSIDSTSRGKMIILVTS